ncbi:MAG: glycosyltransferase family 39 protein [Candidatus Woesebacteria bacterium]
MRLTGIHKKTNLIFFLILLVGSFLRLYRLPETMQFLGDQGRDALIARSILFDHDPAFIGPVTSVGNMYLGPFYYYFMVFPLLLSYPSPVGPAYAVALIGIVTLALLYILGREMIGKRAALIAMGLYAISPVIITNVRFSWNPNIVPFFSLLLVWALWKTLQGRHSYWMLIGLCAAVLFQLHYIALILIGLAGLTWMYELVKSVQQHKVTREFIQATIIAIGIFVVSLVPLLLFDLRHDWLNTRAFLQFFHPTISSEKHFRSFSDFTGIGASVVSMLARVVVEFFGIVAKTLGQKLAVVGLFLYFAIKAFVHPENKARRKAISLLLFVFVVSVIFLSLYSSSVFDHYLGFLFPIVFLVLGLIFANLSRSIFLVPLVVLAIGGFTITSISHYPGTMQMSGTIFQFERTAQAIAPYIPQGKTYNLLSYSPSKDLQAMNYRYFLTTLGKKAASPDDWTSFERLIIIDEEHRAEPIDETQYVIKLWPNRTLVNHIAVPNGPDVYILDR